MNFYRMKTVINLTVLSLLPSILIAQENPCPTVKTILSNGKFVSSNLKDEKEFYWHLTSAPFQDKNQIWTISFFTTLYGTTSKAEALKKGQYIFYYMTNLSEPFYDKTKTCVYSKLSPSFDLVIASVPKKL